MTNVRSNSNNRGRPSSKGKRRTMRGRGDYTDEVTMEENPVKRIEKKIDHIEKFVYAAATPRKASINQAASMAGRALGTAFGQGDLGAFAGDRLARLFGHGDYRVAVKGNSLMAGLAGPTVPKFSGDGRRGTRLTEREFLGNIVSGTVVSGSSVFTTQTFDLNPTDGNTFPWLSKIATLFDQWDPHGIVFEFVTTSSTFNGTSQALGAVIMATDYDAEAANYATKQEMENADYACSSVPSSNLVHGVECDPKERPMPVLYTTVRPGLRNFSSLGDFQIATQGCSTAGTTLGELWVSYDITFYKKQLVSSTTDVQFLTTSSSPATGSPLVLIGPTTSQSQFLTVTQVIGTGTDIFPPASQGAGRYLLTFSFLQSQSQDLTDSNVASNLVNASIVFNRSSFQSDGENYIRHTVVDITAPGARIRINKRTAPLANPVCISICQVPSNFTLV